MRRAAKIDLVQPEVVQALLDAGCTVQSMAPLGAGCPDLLCGFRGIDFTVETKTEEYAKDHPDVLHRQRRWAACWAGRKPVRVTNRREALALVAHLIIEMEPPVV